MPLITIQNKGLKKQSCNIAVMLICINFLVGCGGSGTTDRVIPPKESDPVEVDAEKAQLTIKVPMQMVNAHLKIKLADENKIVFEDKKFNGFDTTFSDLIFKDNRGKIIVAELTGDNQTYMYDPILDKFVPFLGKMHYIGQINNAKQILLITPISEAIFQRSITRSNQFDYLDSDLSKIKNSHIQKSTSEVYTVLKEAFRGSEQITPRFGNNLSITTVDFTSANATQYANLFLGLGYMHMLREKFPSTTNTFLGLAQSIGPDLRDGYLNGSSIIGDNTKFNALVNAPKNTDPLNNSYILIGDHQKAVRDEFSKNLKDSTLKYANEIALQNSVNPDGVEHLKNKVEYFDTSKPGQDNNFRFRWRGAGDYRPAIGLRSLDTCSNGANPCLQGLNVDDLETHVNNIEYLIGTHQLAQCTIKFYPSGDVTITRGDKVYRSSINRDLSDNLQKLNNNPTHYNLNVGASENKPAYFLQFEIKDMQITKARTGYNFDIYSTAIESPEMDCES